MRRMLLIVFTRHPSVKAENGDKNAQQIVPADAQKAARRWAWSLCCQRNSEMVGGASF